jgi:flagellar biosynthesis/type III secretory pathway protein FliH
MCCVYLNLSRGTNTKVTKKEIICKYVEGKSILMKTMKEKILQMLSCRRKKEKGREEGKRKAGKEEKGRERGREEGRRDKEEKKKEEGSTLPSDYTK